MTRDGYRSALPLLQSAVTKRMQGLMLLIKEKTGATNSTAFQQLPADMKKSVLIELKGKRASLRQLERLTGICKSMIYRM